MLWLHLALIQRWSGGADVDAGLTPHGAVEIRFRGWGKAMEM
jgi:hypothetical protein